MEKRNVKRFKFNTLSNIIKSQKAKFEIKIVYALLSIKQSFILVLPASNFA
jgi:hypothetical protein